MKKSLYDELVFIETCDSSCQNVKAWVSVWKEG